MQAWLSVVTVSHVELQLYTKQEFPVRSIKRSRMFPEQTWSLSFCHSEACLSPSCTHRQTLHWQFVVRVQCPRAGKHQTAPPFVGPAVSGQRTSSQTRRTSKTEKKRTKRVLQTTVVEDMCVSDKSDSATTTSLSLSGSLGTTSGLVTFLGRTTQQPAQQQQRHRLCAVYTAAIELKLGLYYTCVSTRI